MRRVDGGSPDKINMQSPQSAGPAASADSPALTSAQIGASQAAPPTAAPAPTNGDAFLGTTPARSPSTPAATGPIGARIRNRVQHTFQGPLVAPGDPSFDEVRKIWNAGIDRTPALIVRCQTADDVAKAIQLSRKEGLPLSVRAGGHNVAGTSLVHDGLMLDLSLMKGMQVDPQKRVATAQPGLLWGEFDRANEQHGLATTGGQVSHTGISGLTLGGGLGYLMGKHGAVCDNLLSVDMVLADGSRVTASEKENPDLFWAVRGAGANFGVVTSFNYRLHPLESVVAGMVLFPRPQTAELMEFHQKFTQNAPPELNTTFALLNSPGGPIVGVIAVYPGDTATGEKILAPLRQAAGGRTPIVDTIHAQPYTEAQAMSDALVPPGDRYYWKSNFVPKVSGELGQILEGRANEMTSPYNAILLFQTTGAIQNVPVDAMAFGHRAGGFEMSVISRWTDPSGDADNKAWGGSVLEAAQGHLSDGVYVNHRADGDPRPVLASYGAPKYQELQTLKARFDPENVFNQYHNIPPANPRRQH